MTDRIDLTGIEVMAIHGVLPAEKAEAQLFRVDAVAYLDLEPAARSDDLSDTLDYATLARRIHDLVAGESHDLLETVANRVASLVLEDARVVRARVTVHKPHAPIDVPFDSVAVTIERSR